MDGRGSSIARWSPPTGLGSCNEAGSRCVDRPPRAGYSGSAGWSSLVARRAHNPEVVGSNPTPATNKTPGQGPTGAARNRPSRLGVGCPTAGTTTTAGIIPRERAVRLVLDHEHEYPSQWKAICSIAWISGGVLVVRHGSILPTSGASTKLRRKSGRVYAAGFPPHPSDRSQHLSRSQEEIALQTSPGWFTSGATGYQHRLAEHRSAGDLIHLGAPCGC